MTMDQAFFFFWIIKGDLNSIEALQKEYRSRLQELMINNEQIPTIIRLNEDEHATEVVDTY